MVNTKYSSVKLYDFPINKMRKKLKMNALHASECDKAGRIIIEWRDASIAAQ